MFALLNSFNSFIVYYLIILPIMARAYVISQTIKYSYYHLTLKVYDNIHQQKSDQIYKKHYISSAMKGSISFLTKVLLIFLTIISIIFAFLCCFESGRCFIFSYSTLGREFPHECSSFDLEIILASSLRVIINFIELFIFITLIFNMYKYPIQSDIFKIRYEFLTILFLWVIHHVLYDGYHLLSDDCNEYVTFTLFFFIHIFLILHYIWLTILRMKINIKEFLEVWQNFDLFMQNHLCFSFFKDFIKNYHPDSFRYVLFWFDYYIYKEQLNLYLQNVDIGQIEYIRLHANYLFEEYFVTNEDTNLDNTSKDVTNVIDFPVDITENIESTANEQFNVDFDVLKDLYDEAYSFVNNKLRSIYATMSSDQHEYPKIEKLIIFLDIKHVNAISIPRQDLDTPRHELGRTTHYS